MCLKNDQRIDERINEKNLPGNCWRKKNLRHLTIVLLLTHPFTHMGRVSMLAVHFNVLSSMFTLCLTLK
ncbi:CLUMA_CG006700, isoform A [Clunio marinus]|uniref:CLUMA_CG006700, isoform A n=1 Tax=Clunio marinus TaxID=568069 RepID=A0A1J1HXY9_9DIPT|nr:CLUMA_CG006700, isoform A [Clunio marinus]